MRYLVGQASRTHISTWLSYMRVACVCSPWGLGVNLLAETTPSTSWYGSAPDIREATFVSGVSSLLLWGVCGSGIRRFTLPVRYRRRTVTRGPMVRKKASRLQVEQVRSRSWFRLDPPHDWLGNVWCSRAYCAPLRLVWRYVTYARITSVRGVAARAPMRIQVALSLPSTTWSLV